MQSSLPLLMCPLILLPKKFTQPENMLEKSSEEVDHAYVLWNSLRGTQLFEFVRNMSETEEGDLS